MDAAVNAINCAKSLDFERMRGGCMCMVESEKVSLIPLGAYSHSDLDSVSVFLRKYMPA